VEWEENPLYIGGEKKLLKDSGEGVRDVAHCLGDLLYREQNEGKGGRTELLQSSFPGSRISRHRRSRTRTCKIGGGNEQSGPIVGGKKVLMVRNP